MYRSVFSAHAESRPTGRAFANLSVETLFQPEVTHLEMQLYR